MKHMTPHRYDQVRTLFFEICDLDPLSRSAILDEKCLDDADLRREVESLLDQEQSDDALLRESRLGLMADAMRAIVDESVTDALGSDRVGFPKSLGRYRLIRKV